MGEALGETAYFLGAKFIKTLLMPGALFIAALLVAFVLLNTRRGALWGRRLLGLALLGYVALGTFPLGAWALNILEDRFPVVRDHEGPVSGIIVLGGALDTTMTRERGVLQLGSSAERMTEFVRLARAHPQAKRVFAGGIGLVFDRATTEAEIAKRFFEDIGFDASQIVFEDRSRNTSESARLAYDLVQPGADETWILITSASHMPRAMGLFRHEGWSVVAHPVDHGTLPGAPTSWWPSWPGGLGRANAAAYEWGALIAARIRGRTDTLLPGPSQ